MTKEAMQLALDALEIAEMTFTSLRSVHQPQILTAYNALKEALAQDEPIAMVIDWGIDGPKLQGLTENWPPVGTLLYTTQPQPEERNFCPRCGKRTADLTVIHTCTPPQENT